MNILVIGNGFDLAHELPTGYKNFLDFCIRVQRIYSYNEGGSVENYVENKILDLKTNNEILDVLRQAVKNRKLSDKGEVKYTTNNIYLDELYDCIRNNAWLKYFSSCNPSNGENWIDFESEISQVIQALDAAMELIKKEKAVNDLSERKMEIISNIIEKIRPDDGKGLQVEEVVGCLDKLSKVITLLERDLNMLIRALEIYLCEFVEKIEIKKISPDIDKLKIDVILSFNYTHTFSRLYQVSEEVKAPFDYIHGEANINNTVEKNNMVLGIDEYLGKKRRNKDIDFIAFKKYYQRIYKETGCKYKNWVDQIKTRYREALSAEEKFRELKNRAKLSDNNMMASEYGNVLKEAQKMKKEMHNLYIFGHSLDVTDKDVLKALILNDNVKTKIFYFSKDDLKAKIANLVKVIGQDELIRRTGGRTKTIEFKLQKKME